MKFKNNSFAFKNGIIDFNVADPITKNVEKFYESHPFPNYKIDDNKLTVLEIGNKNSFTKSLKDFMGFNKSFIEYGSGTCQLSNYMAIGTTNQIVAFDSTYESLKIGKDFAKKNNIQNISFIRGDIIDQIFQDETFDIVLCNGVLHHLKNPYAGFSNIINSLKKDGYIIIGLYNAIGRIRTKIRKYIYKIFGKKIITILDPILRKIDKNSQYKIDAWIRDQYLHPIEHIHTFDEILKWFDQNDIEFINSIPQCSFFETLNII